MAVKKLFKAYIPSVNYVTQKGRTCVFAEGRFLTEHLEEIAELNDVVGTKSNPHIYIDPDESEVDTTLQDRIKEAQIKATLAVMEEHNKEKDKGAAIGQASNAQASEANKTAGMSAATLLGVTNSASIGKMVAPSNTK